MSDSSFDIDLKELRITRFFLRSYFSKSQNHLILRFHCVQVAVETWTGILAKSVVTQAGMSARACVRVHDVVDKWAEVLSKSAAASLCVTCVFVCEMV